MDTFGLNVRRSTRLTLGLDAQASAYHLDTVDGQAYFLKVRKGTSTRLRWPCPPTFTALASARWWRRWPARPTARPASCTRSSRAGRPTPRH